ncbi:hypothetical protein LXA43DRAFT_596314 [Ganoderma leucocontextum]|nr:hypothetical protein LXA43DRAFT_596314 [Ganoderma leucocontextum]
MGGFDLQLGTNAIGVCSPQFPGDPSTNIAPSSSHLIAVLLTNSNLLLSLPIKTADSPPEGKARGINASSVSHAFAFEVTYLRWAGARQGESGGPVLGEQACRYLRGAPSGVYVSVDIPMLRGPFGMYGLRDARRGACCIQHLRFTSGLQAPIPASCLADTCARRTKTIPSIFTISYRPVLCTCSRSPWNSFTPPKRLPISSYPGESGRSYDPLQCQDPPPMVSPHHRLLHYSAPSESSWKF